MCKAIPKSHIFKEHCTSQWVGGWEVVCSHLEEVWWQLALAILASKLHSQQFFGGGALTFTMRTSFEFTTRTLLSSEYFANGQLMLRHSCIKWRILALSGRFYQQQRQHCHRDAKSDTFFHQLC